MLTINTSTLENIPVINNSNPPSKNQNASSCMRDNGYQLEKKYLESLNFESSHVFRRCHVGACEDDCYILCDKENNKTNSVAKNGQDFPKLRPATPILDDKDDNDSIRGAEKKNPTRVKGWKQEIFWSNAIPTGDCGDYRIM